MRGRGGGKEWNECGEEREIERWRERNKERRDSSMKLHSLDISAEDQATGETEIGKMNSNFNDIQKSFKDNFGNFNFSEIKI